MLGIAVAYLYACAVGPCNVGTAALLNRPDGVVMLAISSIIGPFCPLVMMV